MTAPLGDRAARAAIASELGATLVVEAGAGSGKTTQLVARLLAILVGRRARIDQVAAITFTEAAAGELRDRLAGALEGVASSPGPGGEAAADALDGLDGAAVTTLHGFARRLLAEHPFAAGLPPAFEVLDEVRSAVDLGDRWTVMLDRLLEDPGTARALQWALACGVTLGALRSIAAGLDGAWDRVPERPPPAVPPSLRRDNVLGPLRDALRLAGECTDPGDGLLAHLRGLAPWADRLADCGDEVELLGVLAGLGGRVATARGRQAAWHGRKPEVAGLLALAEAGREQALAAAAAYAMRAVGDALGGMVREAAAERRREGRLHFHDLLVLARDLVRDHPEAQAAVHEQYRYVLVDEVQDTDPLQADLAVRVASPWPAGGGRRWQDLEVGAGRLFYVGDPKQSIYRFRGADDRLFREAAALLVDEPLLLTSNFRSTPGILAWVDAVFARLAPADGPAHVPLEAVRPPHGGGPVPPVVLIGAHGEPPATAAEARAAEAADVAAAVLAAREDRWPVGDGSRPATFADVTVLVRTRAAVPALEEAFDRAGIPYRLESSSLVYQAPEVQDLLSVLWAVDDPTDQGSVVAALRSPGFGCGDDDLLRHRLAGGGWDYRVAGAGDGPVAEGLRALHALHGDRWWLEVSELVARVVDERRLLPLCLDGPRWREAWRRLRFVLDQARQFTEGPAGDLRAFLEWVDVQRGEDARVTEVVLPEGDVDAVRVMTVHAAKGLEFPVVVVAGFGSEPRRAAAGVLFGPDGPELAARRDLATPGYGALDEAERALDEAERVRLLYVAATRARDHLVVSVHRSARAGGTVAARLADACAACPDLWRPHDAPGPPAPAGEPAPPPGAAGGPEERAAWAAARRRWLGPEAAPATVAATAVARLAAATAGAPGGGGGPSAAMPVDATGAGEAAGEADPGRPAWRRGRAGTSVGRAVHGVLQVVDLATGEGLAELSAAQAAAEGVGDRAAEVEALARSALASGVVRSAVASGRYWRELYVGTPVGGRVLEGIVDLLFDGPRGLEVVDYKTDQDEDLDRALDAYRLQGATYAVAVERVVGRPVARCSFLFLRRHGAVAREVADLDAARREVEGAVGAA